MKTLKLDANWDITLDTNYNISVVDNAEAIAQDVASAISTFKGEVYYDTTLGMPYFGQILGEAFNKQLLQTLFQKAALTVPEVVQAKASITDFTGRAVHGTVEVIDSKGAALGVSF